MQNEPPRRRPRRRGRGGARPVRPQAQPVPPPATRSVAKRPLARAPRRRPQRPLDELRPGTPCVVLMDCREGEPDRSGSAASFEGFFDFETGEPRRPGYGIPRLRIGAAERVWGFEVWWRLDPTRAGLTDADREELEASKKLLRTLVRDARRRTPLAIR
jgi:hypothetical protein